MALEDLTPFVRVETILDGADIEPATRLEYFLKKAANEVPKPTSSDIGKVLTVGEGSETVQTVIVPEQTVTVESTPVPLVGADASGFVVGNTGVMTVNGTDHNVTATDMGGPERAIVYGDQESGFMIAYVQGSVLFKGSPGTYTVSLTASVPSVEPKWDAAEPVVALKVVRMISASSHDHCTDFAVNKSVEDIETCFNVDTFKPVYALLPAVTPSMPYYDYTIATYIALVSAMPTETEQSLIGDWRILLVDGEVVLRVYTQA